MNIKIHILNFMLALMLSTSAHAATSLIKPFKAEFNVLIFGTAIGTATHKFSCHQQNCQLRSEAIPPSWARRFINEEAIEVSDIHQTDQAFTLIKYTKYLTRRYDDKTLHKTTTLIRDTVKNRIHFIEKNKNWPSQPQAYDMISMAYAIQYLVLNHRPLNNLYLQDDKIQQKLVFSEKNVADEIEIDFPKKSTLFDEVPPVKAKRYHFSNKKVEVTLWLLPQYHLFPGKIAVYNKIEDRKIVLELIKLHPSND